MKLFYKKIVFCISCFFVYGGTVNYGGFDFFPAIPFLIFILYSAYKWRKTYLLTTILLTLVCIPLYILKKQHGNLFHPNIGREFTFNQSICLTEYAYKDEHFVLASEIRTNLPCNSSNMSDAIKWEPLPLGTKLKIKKISVSNADLGESYVIHADSNLGEIALHNNDFTVWLDGKKIEQNDLRREIFYIPSLLMFWPIAPFFLPAIFFK